MNTSAALEQTRSGRGKPMETKTLLSFFAITFGLTWGLAALLIFFYDQIVAIFGEISSSNPLFILAVYAPGIAGIILVLWQYGLKGLGSFLAALPCGELPWPGGSS